MGGPTPKPERPCNKCGLVQPTENFGRYLSGGIKIRCMTCAPPGSRSRRCGQGPWEVPQPCAHCHETWSTKGNWSHVKLLKYCSVFCMNDARRVAERMCLRCKRTLPGDAFDTIFNGRAHATNRICKRCQIDRDSHPDLGMRPRPSFTQLFTTTRDRALKANQDFRLRRIDVKRLHAKDCELCGRVVSSLVLKDAKKPWTTGNVRLLCRRCFKIHRVCGFAHLLLWAHEVAIKNPLVPQDDSHGQSKTSQQRHPLPQQAVLERQTAPRVHQAHSLRRG